MAVTLPTMALCLRGHPSVAAEAAAAPLIVTARIVQQRQLFEDASDPEGVTGTVYSAEVTSWVKGASPAQIQIYSENTSSRFPMDVQSDYVLWLFKDGTWYFVDNCGNSTELAGHSAVLESVKREQERIHEGRGD